MENKPDNIELRSEGVRHIIGQIPPWIIRFGISLLFVLSIAIFLVAYFVKYAHQIDAEANVIVKENAYEVSILVPANQYELVAVGQEVWLYVPVLSDNTYAVKCKINRVEDSLHLVDKAAYYHAVSYLQKPIKAANNKYIIVDRNMKMQAVIPTRKMSFVERMRYK